MEMSNHEIVHRYIDLETPISVLAELNAVSNDEIRDVLRNEGVIIKKGTLRPKRHIVDPKPAKPYQGESKSRKPDTKSGLYTKEAKVERALNRKNKDLKKVLNEAGYKTSDDNQQNTKETQKVMPVTKNTKSKKEAEKAAEPTNQALVMNDTLKGLIFSQLDELEVKIGYHQEQIRQYEIEYKELCESIGIKRNFNK